jgi:hypothetical protein
MLMVSNILHVALRAKKGRGKKFKLVTSLHYNTKRGKKTLNLEGGARAWSM